MIPIVKDFHSPDVDRVWEWVPVSQDEVCFLLEVNIGMPDVEGSDIFQFVVATPKGSAKLPRGDDGVLSDRCLILMSEYSWDALQERLRLILSKCGAEDWGMISSKLERYFQWEFEDYVIDDDE